MMIDRTAGRNEARFPLAAGGGALVAFLVLLPAVGACTPDSGPVPITESRTVSRPSREVFLGATPEDRFGPTRRPSRSSPDRPAGSEAPDLTYDLPPGWEVLESSRMRLLHFRPAGDSRSVCYLSALPGDGGGTVANVNRWRSQMGEEPATDEEVAAMPTYPLLGGRATFVQAEGTLTEMSGESLEDAELVGLILTHDQFAFFLKMTGPSSVIAGEVEGFLRLAASIRVGASSDDPAPTPEPTQASDSGLLFDAPEGWFEKPAGTMRVLSFDVGERGTECYVAVLGGGGGLEANVNRWRGQLGQDVLGSEEIAALPRIQVLGYEAPLVEVEGEFTGMGGQALPDHALLGTIVERPGGMLFVKMVGPREEVAAHREHFLSFVRSLEVME